MSLEQTESHELVEVLAAGYRAQHSQLEARLQAHAILQRSLSSHDVELAAEAMVGLAMAYAGDAERHVQPLEFLNFAALTEDLVDALGDPTITDTASAFLTRLVTDDRMQSPITKSSIPSLCAYVALALDERFDTSITDDLVDAASGVGNNGVATRIRSVQDARKASASISRDRPYQRRPD